MSWHDKYRLPRYATPRRRAYRLSLRGFLCSRATSRRVVVDIGVKYGNVSYFTHAAGAIARSMVIFGRCEECERETCM